MLGTLIKYELPAIGRKLLPIYGAWMVVSLLMGLSLQTFFVSSNLIRVIGIMLYVAVTAATVVVSIWTIVQRYRSCLWGEEGYFYLTLPATTTSHLWSKILSALVFVAIAMVASVLSLLLVLLGAGEMRIITEGLANILDLDDWVIFYVELLFLAFLSTGKTILAIYAAISIGQQPQRHNGILAVGVFIGFVVAESIFTYILDAAHLFPPIGATAIYFTPLRAAQPAFAISAALLLVLGALYFFIAARLMKHRLNLP